MTQTSPDVVELLSTLQHPHKDAILALRGLIREADPRVVEQVKWNAPSFALRDGSDFATFQLRAKKGVQLVLHFGAKKRTVLPKRSSIADPGALLHWLADDRASVTFADASAVEAKRDAFVALMRGWIAAIPA